MAPSRSAPIEIFRGFPPSGDAIFMSTDVNGTPGDLNSAVLSQLKLSPSKFLPNSAKLKTGYCLIQVNKSQTIGFIVTVDGGRTNAALKTNLARALRDRQLRDANSFWIPLMGTGVGKLTPHASLAATLDAIKKSRLLSRSDVEITISAAPETTETDLSHLKQLLHSYHTDRPAPAGSAKLLPLTPEVTAVLAASSLLDLDKRQSNGQVTTSLVLFCLAEARQSNTPLPIQRSKEATAFADLLRTLAGAAYEAASEKYFRDDFSYAQVDFSAATSDTRPLSKNMQAILRQASSSASRDGRAAVEVNDLINELLRFSNANYRRTLEWMNIDAERLLREFIARLPATIQATFVNDLATDQDGLDHLKYADAIASFLVNENTRGPLSVSIQAPWGAGKSSLMRLIRAKLDPEEVQRLAASTRIGDPRKKSPSGKRLTLRGVLSFLDGKRPANSGTKYIGNPVHRWTIWFNAWKYESSEQVWAGLVDAIVTQVSDRLDPIARELFLLRLNLARIDDGAVRRKIYERVFTLWWTRVRGWLLAAAAVAMSLVGIGTIPSANGALLDVLKQLRLPELQHPSFATAILILALTLGYVAIAFLRTHFKVGAEPAKFSLAEYLKVPDYQKSVGVVHQIHEDLRRVLRVLPKRANPDNPAELIPQPLVIFIDDLDRCSPNKVANVVEGVNMFLASDLYECIFIIGMDPQIVAAALDQAHKDVRERLPAYERAAPLAGGSWISLFSFLSLFRSANAAV